MSAAKHTPAPWFEYDPNFLGVAVAVRGEQPNSTRVIADFSQGREATDEDRANARLFLAAPDLLEEHRRSLRTLERVKSWLDENRPHPLSEFVDASIKATRAVIAKAEGGE